MKLSLCCIVKNEQDNLKAMWASVRSIVDEFVVVDTGSIDNTAEVARELGAKVFEEGDRFCEKLSQAHVDFFKTFGVEATVGQRVFHFGNARTFSFEKATGDFIMWLDADDILIGSDKLKKIIELNLKKESQLGLSLLYKYELDKYQNCIVKHYRERLFPNNGTFKWKGRIHEIVVPTIETKYITVKSEDCHVLHNVVAEEKRFTSGVRNTNALLLDLYEQGADQDPRTLYQLAESFVSDPKRIDQARELYEKYLEKSGWDEERSLVATRLCDIWIKKGDYQQALNWAYRSVQEMPSFPQGYANIAQCYYALEDYSNCELFAKRALELEQPETFTFVNDKHNEFTPTILLATVYFKLGKVKEAIEYSSRGLRMEPQNEQLLQISHACQRGIEEEKITEAFKLIKDYLKDEGELAKSVSLFKSVPSSHEEDPRMIGMKNSSMKHLIGELSKQRESDQGLDEENLDKDLVHAGYLLKELRERGAKSVFVVSAENVQTLATWLTSKGFDVSTVSQDDAMFDCVVAFGLIDRVFDQAKLIKFMVSKTKPTGFCVVTNQRPGSEIVSGQVHSLSVNSIRNTLDSFRLTVWTCIPLRDVIYTNFLPGKPETKTSIGFICGESVEEWNPLSIHKGVGGSEEATIYLSKELVALGHKVTVYNNITQSVTYEGVHWKHFSSLNDNEKMDLAILWRAPHLMEQLPVQAKRFWLWLHDVPEEYWFTPDRLEKLEKIIVLSKYHRGLLPNVPDEKFFISSNGVELSQFDQKVDRNPKKVIYTSSYDRGLEHLLDIWPEVLSEVTDAELHIYYGWGNWDKMRTLKTQRDWKTQMLKKMNQPGVFEHGRISHLELSKEMLGSGIFAYPCHFEEISCISAMKGQVAGCVPLTTDYAALAETNLNEATKVEGKADNPEVMVRFKEALIECLKNQIKPKVRKEISNLAKKTFSWKSVAQKWSVLANG